jgi:hypothetical protein
MLAVWGRTAAVLAVTGPLALTTIVSTPKAGEAKDDVASQIGTPKDEVRLEAWTPPSLAAPTDASRATDRRSPTHLFVAEPSGEAARFVSPWEFAEPGRFAPWSPVSAAPEWREEEFAQVDVADARTLRVGPLRIELIGLDLPMGEQVCRTLDGRFEPCATRAATQLELLTRHRNIICHYRLERAGEAIGRCRVGTSDLTERMVQTGYVWRSAALPVEGGH